MAGTVNEGNVDYWFVYMLYMKVDVKDGTSILKTGSCQWHTFSPGSEYEISFYLSLSQMLMVLFLNASI